MLYTIVRTLWVLPDFIHAYFKMDLNLKRAGIAL
jgi:hypothetical protein